MSRNEGTFDRILRAIVGLALMGLVLFTNLVSPVLFWGASLVATVLLITALTGFCPAYRLLGLQTCRKC
ncbi:Protein of unknown function [Modicisalibacter ilicicola DSM 19980]|uniref:Inner membrane protein YgaP-like transmembrane domain-containing protein n=1 Tax=Modicisalibacter ilicicola DSM 19980 TaxID=1121942 RepID=A0A1M5DWL3_9GAMM|nr:DUF2892 domain-containing protein [Halomonas ilicicola]SHF71244.1 Protein of unknown function [Halomonas ilicicola DSM 19980]